MPPARTVVLNCAGIGSRLGLGRTKVLMEVGGQSLLSRHLRAFCAVRDLRIVVGFQSADVIAATLAIRRDVVFVYNHEYFTTGAGHSFWLGARFGTDEVVQWDGDLLIHPEDAARCLAHDGPFVAYSDIRSEDGVFCALDARGRVTGFSRERGIRDRNALKEWTGPCCLPRAAVCENAAYVYPMLERLLPLPGLAVRAMDIDTMNDYRTAETMLNQWGDQDG